MSLLSRHAALLQTARRSILVLQSIPSILQAVSLLPIRFPRNKIEGIFEDARHLYETVTDAMSRALEALREEVGEASNVNDMLNAVFEQKKVCLHVGSIHNISFTVCVCGVVCAGRDL